MSPFWREGFNMTVASDLIASGRAYADSLVAQATNALNDATDAVNAVGYTDPGYVPVTLPATPPTSISLSLPTFNTVTLDLPAAPTTTLVFQDISPIVPGAQPTLNATVPTLTLPTAPSQTAGFNEAAPTINTGLAFPTAPDELLHPTFSAPTLADRMEPTKPQTTLPGFSAAAPTDTTVAPTNLDTTFDTAYRTAAPSTMAMVNGYVDAELTKLNPRYTEQMGAIENQLAAYLAGGTGLSADVENAIYERAKDKNLGEARRVRDTAFNDMAGRGFTMPTGALLSAAQQARQNGADSLARASTEITVMQAEMEQKNLQFAVTTSASIRQWVVAATLSYMQNLVSINGQALDYAKSILGAVIEVYNASVKAFSVRLDAYRAQAAVYETQLKSAMAGIELYRIEIQALEALTQVDKAKVDVYRARIESLTALSGVFRAQVEAVLGQVTLEKSKLDLFQSKVQAYSAVVQGKNVEWQGYRAAIEGQTALVGIYNSQVQGFVAQTEAYKTGISAQSEVVRAQAATNAARATQYNATLDGYKTIVATRGEVARTQLENQRQTVTAFDSQVRFELGKAQVANEYYKASSTVGIANADFRIRSALGFIESRRGYQSVLAQLASTNASVYGGTAAAGLSGLNSLASETAAA
jgi:hypothetical protein